MADVLFATLGSKTLPDTIPIRSVHFALWRLSGEPRYARLLGPLSFANGPGGPISEELETALFRLCSSGLCTVDNPDFRYLRTARKSRAAMRRVLKRDSSGERLTELGQLSKDFEEHVREWMGREAGRLSIQSV
jgi:hypothetical protein